MDLLKISLPWEKKKIQYSVASAWDSMSFNTKGDVSLPSMFCQAEQ